MAKKITDRPFPIRFNIVETSANTYTEQNLDLPVAIVGVGKIQAIEILAVVGELDLPSAEPGVANNVWAQLVRDTQTTKIRHDDEDLIWAKGRQWDSEDAAGIEAGALAETTFDESLVYDGDGEIVMERQIHMGILGSGNAAARRVHGKLICHLVELTASEVIPQLFLDND